MSKIRNRFERFCYRNRNIGIANLMLYITLANAVVYVIGSFTNSKVLYDALCFNRDLILEGQVWRLLTCVFTSVFNYNNPLFVFIGLFCYYTLGNAIENTWGTLRFNLFYLTGLILMDTFAMALGGVTFTYDGVRWIMPTDFYADMGSYLNLSLFIAYATLNPDNQFLFFFVIPVKAWIFALFYLGITLYEVVQYTFIVTAFPHGLFPLVALLNYFLFFGKDCLNVIPFTRRSKTARNFRKVQKTTVQYKTVPFPNQSTPPAQAAYTHRCAICGRTDISNPELEFRYCSRCNGYYCYCEDHISEHTHVQ